MERSVINDFLQMCTRVSRKDRAYNNPQMIILVRHRYKRAAQSTGSHLVGSRKGRCMQPYTYKQDNVSRI